MNDVISFINCDFCGIPASDPSVSYMFNSSYKKGTYICDACIRKLHVMLWNCYNGMFEDEGFRLNENEGE